MAKRKRLGGPLQDYLATSEALPDRAAAASAPIAQVAGETSVNAAFDEVSRELTSARTEGRLVVRLPLDGVEADWLIRDRTHPGTAEDPDFAALLDSLRRYGQRTPIEVVETAEGRYGLISGWRRLTALKQLHQATEEERFATILAFMRQPASSEDAYVAMVEENEIRLGLSYYERAQIAAKSVEAGVYPSTRAALQSLFASASRAKRSKIGSFLTLYQSLGDTVRFPQALTERSGLSLVKLLEADDTAGERLRALLEESRAESVETEQSLFAAFIKAESNKEARQDTEVQGTEVTASSATPAATPAAKPAGKEKSVSDASENEICPGVHLTQRGGVLQLSGPAVDQAFRDRLEAWLRENAQA